MHDLIIEVEKEVGNLAWKDYDRAAAVRYAERWAMRRNPEYADFTQLGGDCTNFVSQCLHAGCGVMNDEKENGWYYRSMASRAPAWSGVRFLHRFLLREDGVGPVGESCAIEQAGPGDVIFLSDGERLYHALLVVANDGQPRIAAHTIDCWMRPLGDYGRAIPHPVHIVGVRR